jgi:uncharacterized protein YbaR (Trm112 family)
MDMVLMPYLSHFLWTSFFAFMILFGLYQVANGILSIIRMEIYKKKVKEVPSGAVCVCPLCGEKSFHIIKREDKNSALLICKNCKKNWVMTKIPHDMLDRAIEVLAKRMKGIIDG